MALNTTTLGAAMLNTDTFVTLASTTGVNAPAFPTGPVTYLVVENELMIVSSFSGVSGTAVGVIRGQGGTKALAHGNTAPVLVFLATDFGSLFSLGLQQANFNTAISLLVGAPIASATTITPSVWGPGTCFHVTGSTELQTISLPTGVIQTQITIICDSTLTWGTSGNIAIGSSGTQTTTAVTFFYDSAQTKWYPSKISA